MSRSTLKVGLTLEGWPRETTVWLKVRPSNRHGESGAHRENQPPRHGDTEILCVSVSPWLIYPLWARAGSVNVLGRFIASQRPKQYDFRRVGLPLGQAFGTEAVRARCGQRTVARHARIVDHRQRPRATEHRIGVRIESIQPPGCLVTAQSHLTLLRTLERIHRLIELDVASARDANGQCRIACDTAMINRCIRVFTELFFSSLSPITGRLPSPPRRDQVGVLSDFVRSMKATFVPRTGTMRSTRAAGCLMSPVQVHSHSGGVLNSDRRESTCGGA